MVSSRGAAAGEGPAGPRRAPRQPPPADMSCFPARGLVAAVRGRRGFSVCESCALRRFSIQPAQQKKIPNRYLGQPSPFTHPHLLKPGEVTPGLSQVEYALRRHKLMSLIQKEAHGWGGLDHTVILLSNPMYYMTNDIPYVFHQDTNFLYLCGFQEPDSILVLQSIPGKALPSHKSILFVPRRDPSRELWDGPRSGTDGAIALTGVDEAYTIEEFRHLVSKLKGESNIVWYDSAKPVHTELHSDYMQPLAEIKARNKNHIQGIRHLVQNLRLIKSPAEIERMKIAGRVTAEAFIETMFASKSPVDEAFLYAKDGELVLLDGGCESSCYVSDITRTWPVNGRFTKPQAELYQAVLDIQKSCLSLCSPGMSLENIYSLMLSLIGQKLKELGILKSSITDSHFFKAVRKYCPHHVGHYLGMDVHDTPDISRSLPLQPGMVITIEPGIYIPEDDASAPERFRGIGVRIEDDVVITEDAPLILSADCPKEVYHIEQICGRSS
ncbi:xaa-Pro aminopeptidase 3 isoform X2 [Chroicocephalus ridibundus]|uniref:xaa-Pro aminopeptidase 3 isoform X2 n=1 Tax=Chroicocephalus ridibundus TaxID=1192867 RepID=UPI002FDE034F